MTRHVIYLSPLSAIGAAGVINAMSIGNFEGNAELAWANN